jgi:hypothetical protein
MADLPAVFFPFDDILIDLATATAAVSIQYPIAERRSVREFERGEAVLQCVYVVVVLWVSYRRRNTE